MVKNKEALTKISKEDRKRLYMQNTRRSSRGTDTLSALSEDQLMNIVYSIEADDDTSSFFDSILLRLVFESPNFPQNGFTKFIDTESQMIVEEIIKSEKAAVNDVLYILQRSKNALKEGNNLLELAMTDHRIPVSYFVKVFGIFENDRMMRHSNTNMWNEREDLPIPMVEFAFIRNHSFERDRIISVFPKFQRPVKTIIEGRSFHREKTNEEWVTIRDEIGKPETNGRISIVVNFKNWIDSCLDNYNEKEETYYVPTTWYFDQFNPRFVEAAQIDGENQEIVQKLMNHNDPLVRLALAMNESLTDETFQDLADDESVDVQLMVAMNKSVPSSVLEDLAQSNDELTRILVAMNENTPAKSLVKFYDEESYDNEVRREAMMNVAFPVQILREEMEKNRLAKKWDEFFFLTGSNAWEFEDLDRFAQMSNLTAKFNVLRNPRFPKAMKTLYIEEL